MTDKQVAAMERAYETYKKHAQPATSCPLCHSTHSVDTTLQSEPGTHYCYRCSDWFTPGETLAELPTPEPFVRRHAIPEIPTAKPDTDKYQEEYLTLDPNFIQAMEEIGLLGRDKYGDNCIEARIKRGDLTRIERIHAREIGRHAHNHFEEYLDGVKHDVYKTRKHQLAAVAFNAMMEFMLAGLDKEPMTAADKT